MGPGHSRKKSLGGIVDINITPFVDVVLVLLVIFMVTAPMMMKNIIGLNLPKTQSADVQMNKTLAIAVTKAGQFLLNGQVTDLANLAEIATKESQANTQIQAVITADLDARHGDVVRVLDIVKSSGIENFAIQVEKSP